LGGIAAQRGIIKKLSGLPAESRIRSSSTIVVTLDLLAPNTLVRGSADTYTIINLIGRGGMGAVYRARRNSDGTVWALKEMRPQGELSPEDMVENRTLFMQEARLLQSLDSPYLPVVADLFEFEGRPTMVMEFVPGETLEERIHEANAPLYKQQALSYGIQLCRVLHYLHTQTPPIIYRDLKPPNVMLTPDGVLKLIDFGVARTHKEGKRKDTIAMGSAGYAPPEQYGKGQTDARSDIYALGATLLHVLTNMPPVPLQTPQPGLITRLNGTVDAQTEAAIIKAMSLDRTKRFASCSELEQVLHQCLDSPYVDPIARATPPPPVVPQAQAAAAPTALGTAPPPPPAQPQPAVPATPPAAPATDGTACQRCGRVNKARARFCAGCGAPLSEPQPPRLMVKSPYRSWEITINQVPFRIGRRDPRQGHFPELDLAEHDRGISSRHHATIQRDGSFYAITDLGSTNGTRLNGNLIAARVPQRLRQGDRITIGEVDLEFHWS
jgi:serine/threonine protein kinase